MRNLAIYRVRDNKSGSAYNLTQSLGVNQYISKELKHELLDDTMFLNFGRSRMPEWWNKAEAKGCTFINHPNAVARAVNKIKTFRRLNAFGITTLPHTTKRDVARAWYEKGYGIMVRNRVRGCCGKGIEFIPPASMREGIEYNIPKAPLYTMYIDKKYEYRLHIFCDEVIDIQQKKKMGKAKRDARGIEEVNEVVRTNNNGWVFARNDIEDLPTYAINQAKDAVKCLGLDFAAIDMFYVPVHAPYQRSKFYVCEVNTSPSLSDSNTLSRYLSHIEQNKNNDWYKLNKPEGFTNDEDLEEHREEVRKLGGGYFRKRLHSQLNAMTAPAGAGIANEYQPLTQGQLDAMQILEEAEPEEEYYDEDDFPTQENW